MKEAKHIHSEILEREDYSWRSGWKPGHYWVTGVLWGIILVELILILIGVGR